MIRFQSDYEEGAHPKILDRLFQSNLEQTPGYGEDRYCREAACLIREKCARQDIGVFFMVGGTQTNLTVISAALRPHQGVICADSGHINTHESGSIEATGHKVLSVPCVDGKLTAEQIQAAYSAHYDDATHEHMVQPKLVYLSFPTELGTIYSREELTAISQVCRKNGLLLYVDGARMGYGLCAEGNNIDLPAFAQLCDAFYIGGTKIGALFGEALVICNPLLREDIRYIIKQKGGLLAKGRLLGLQFLTLFEDGLYFQISVHANRMAMLIREACLQKGYGFLTPSPTNQQFPILPDTLLENLHAEFGYSYWQRIDAQTSAVRFCTSWTTNEKDVARLIAAIKNN